MSVVVEEGAGGMGGPEKGKKCHILFEWPLNSNSYFYASQSQSEFYNDPMTLSTTHICSPCNQKRVCVC